MAVYYTSSTSVVKSKIENTLGLYDVTGNVWEWLFDSNDDMDKRLFRGSSYLNSHEFNRIGFKYFIAPFFVDDNNGFRFVKTGRCE